jgi:hypothetical protein
VSTTSLIVEMVVIGLQTAIWIIILLLSIAGLDRFSSILKFGLPDLAVGLIAFGACYTLGIVFDAATAWMEDQYTRLWEKRHAKHRRDAIPYEERKRLRVSALIRNPEIATHLDNTQPPQTSTLYIL